MSSAATRLEPSTTVTRNGTGFLAGEKRKVILCLLLFAVTLGFYNPIVHDGFVLLDDVPYILDNPPVKAGLTWQTVKWSFTHFHAGYWHPLTWMSHALDCQLFGLNPAGHHYVSLLFHAANAVLLFVILEEATALLWPSLLVAFFFAVHPVNVESVAWAAERKNVLSMFFFLAAIWAYGRYARRGSARWYSAVVALFALGMMAKPQVVTLPCVLLLWDYWPLNRLFPSRSDAQNSVAPVSLGRIILEKIPLFVIAALGSVLTVKAQRTADAVRKLSEYPLGVRLENAVVSYWRYLGELFWPYHLTPLYPHPENSLRAWEIMSASALLVVITAAVLYWHKRRYLAVGWFWFLGVMVPMIGLVQVGQQAMADRFVYIPMIGVEIALFWALWEMLERRSLSPAWLAVPAGVAIVVLGVHTHSQLSYWKDGETLWKYTLSVTKENYMAEETLAMVLDKEGRVEEAIPHFRAAEALHEFPPQQVLSLGIYEQRNGHLQDAFQLYEKVLHRTSDPQIQATAWDQIGAAHVQAKDYEQAGAAFDNALHLKPDDSAALIGRALLAERKGQSGASVTLINRALRKEPTDVGLLLLADALRRDQRMEEADAAEAAAKRVSPNFPRAQSGAKQTLQFFGIDVPASSETRAR